MFPLFVPGAYITRVLQPGPGVDMECPVKILNETMPIMTGNELTIVDPNTYVSGSSDGVIDSVMIFDAWYDVLSFEFL